MDLSFWLMPEKPIMHTPINCLPHLTTLSAWQGGSMSDCIANQMSLPLSDRYSPEHGLDWLSQVASAIQYLQSQNPIIIHRDM